MVVFFGGTEDKFTGEDIIYIRTPGIYIRASGIYISEKLGCRYLAAAREDTRSPGGGIRNGKIPTIL